jgi:hypothetical protein
MPSRVSSFAPFRLSFYSSIDSSQAQQKGVPVGVIVGLAIGGVLLVALVVGVLLLLRCRRFQARGYADPSTPAPMGYADVTSFGMSTTSSSSVPIPKSQSLSSFGGTSSNVLLPVHDTRSLHDQDRTSVYNLQSDGTSIYRLSS